MTHEKGINIHSGSVRVSETEGNIFDAPEDSVLIHAVNCQGAWGYGIAAAFKSKYPVAFEVYKLHCEDESELPGTCLLIPPQIEDHKPSLPNDDDSVMKRTRGKVSTNVPSKKHWIGCLFTSFGYGKPTKSKAGKDSPKEILRNTRAALKDLREQVEALDAGHLDPAQEDFARGGKDTGKISGEGAGREREANETPDMLEARLNTNLGPLYACKFNSGSFGVEWRHTRAIIEEVFDGSSRAMHVISPPSQRK